MSRDHKNSKRRRHFKVEKLSCRQMIDQMLQNGHTYDEIVEEVRKVGEEISDSALSRYHRSLTKRLEGLQRTKQSIKALIETTRDDPDLDIAKATNSLIHEQLFNRIMSADEKEFEEMDIDTVARLSALLERSGVTRERLKLEHNRGVRAAMKKIKESLPHEIKADPELYEKLCQLIDSIGEEMIENGSSRTRRSES